MIENYLINWKLDILSRDENELSIPMTKICVQINGEKYHLFDDAQQGEYISQILQNGGLYRCINVEKQNNEHYVNQAWNDAEASTQGWMDFEIIRKIKLAELTQ